MTTRTFIEKAIEGGWCPTPCLCCGKPVADNRDECKCGDASVVIDPLAWKAVGKVEGWPQEGVASDLVLRDWIKAHWKGRMHAMIDALAEGESIEDYLATL